MNLLQTMTLADDAGKDCLRISDQVLAKIDTGTSYDEHTLISSDFIIIHIRPGRVHH